MKRLAVNCLLLSCVAITLAERQHKRDIAFFQNLLTSRLFDNEPIDTRTDFEVYQPSAINAPLIQPNTIITEDRTVPKEMAQILPTTIFYPPIFCRWFGGLDSLQELNTIFSTVNNEQYNPYMHRSNIDGTSQELRLDLPTYSPAIEVSNPWAVDIKHPAQLPSRYSYELVQNNMFAENYNGQRINKPIRTKPAIPTAKNVNAPMAFDLKQQIEIPSKYIYKQLDNNNFVIFTGENTHKGTEEHFKINSALPMTNNEKPHIPIGSSYSYTQMRDNKPVAIFSSKNNPEFVSIKTNPVTSIFKEATKPVKDYKSHGGQLGSRYSYKQIRNDDSVIIFTGNDNHGSLKESSNINPASVTIEVGRPFKEDKEVTNQIKPKYSYTQIQNNKPIALYTENGHTVKTQSKPEPINKIDIPLAINLNQQSEMQSKYMYKQLKNNGPAMVYTGDNKHTTTVQNNPGFKKASNSREAASPSSLKINSYSRGNENQQRETETAFLYKLIRNNEPIIMFKGNNNPEPAKVPVKMNSALPVGIQAVSPFEIYQKPYNQIGSKYSYTQIREKEPTMIFSSGNNNQGTAKDITVLVENPEEEDKKIVNQIEPEHSYTQIQKDKSKALFTAESDTVSAKTQAKPEQPQKMDSPFLNQQSEIQSKYIYKQVKNNEPVMVFTGDNKQKTTVINNPGLKKASDSIEVTFGNENQQRGTETTFSYKQIRNNEPVMVFTGSNNPELAKLPAKMNSALPVVAPLETYENQHNQIGSKYSYKQIREKEPTMIFSSGNNNQGMARDITIVVENPVEEDKKIVNQIKPKYSYTQVQNNTSKALLTGKSDAISAKTQANREQPQKVDSPVLNKQSEIQSKYIYKQVKNNEPVMVFTGDNKQTTTVENNPGLKKASDSIDVTSGNENKQRGTETTFSYKQIRNNEPEMVFTGSNNPELAKVPVKMNSALPVVAPLETYENQHNQIGSKYSYTQIRDNESTMMVSNGNNNQGSITPKYSYTQIQNNKPMAVFTEQGNTVSVKTQTESVLPMNIKKRIDDVIMLGAFPYKIRELSPVLRFPPLEDIVYPNVRISNPETGVRLTEDSTLQSNSQSVNVHSNINNTPDTARVNPVDIFQTLGPMPQYDKYIVVETKCVDAKINKEKDNTEDVSRVEGSTNSAAVPHITYMQSKPVPDNVQTDVIAIATNKVETNANDKVKDGTFLQKHPIVVPDDIKYSYKQKNNDGSATEFKANKEKVSVDQSKVTEIEHNIPPKDKQELNGYYVLPVTIPSTTDSSTIALSKATSEVNARNEKLTSPLKSTYSYQQINHKESSSINVKGNKDGVSVDIMKQSTPNRGDIPDGN